MNEVAAPLYRPDIEPEPRHIPPPEEAIREIAAAVYLYRPEQLPWIRSKWMLVVGPAICLRCKPHLKLPHPTITYAAVNVTGFGRVVVGQCQRCETIHWSSRP